MKILQVTPYFAPAWAYGGPPVTVYHLSQALAARGHEVTVLTTDAFSENKRMKASGRYDGLDVHHLPNASNRLAWKHQLFLPLGMWSFLESHRSDFDIVHIHMYRTYQNIVAGQYSTKYGIPYVLSAHGSVPRIVRMKHAKALFDGFYGHRLLRNAARLIAVSEAEMSQYIEAGASPSQVSVIYNGVDATQYEKLPPRGAFAAEHGLTGRRLVTYVGRLNARKGLDTLVRAFSMLAKRDHRIALVLVGTDDGYQKTLDRLLEQLKPEAPVVFTGLIPLPGKLQVYVDSDVIVYPGSYEIFGLVPFEALLCGRPVVVANDSGCGEIIERAHAGLAVPPGDPDALCEALGYAFVHPTEMQAMVARGKQFVLEQLNWAHIAQETEGVYENSRVQPTRTASATHVPSNS